jgi:hypothetical protein
LGDVIDANDLDFWIPNGTTHEVASDSTESVDGEFDWHDVYSSALKKFYITLESSKRASEGSLKPKYLKTASESRLTTHRKNQRPRIRKPPASTPIIA